MQARTIEFSVSGMTLVASIKLLSFLLASHFIPLIAGRRKHRNHSDSQSQESSVTKVSSLVCTIFSAFLRYYVFSDVTQRHLKFILSDWESNPKTVRFIGKRCIYVPRQSSVLQNSVIFNIYNFHYFNTILKYSYTYVDLKLLRLWLYNNNTQKQ